MSTMDKILLPIAKSAKPDILGGKTYSGYDLLAQFIIKGREDLLGNLRYKYAPIIGMGKRAELVYGLKTHPKILRVNAEILGITSLNIYEATTDDLVVAILSRATRIYDATPDYEKRLKQIEDEIELIFVKPKPTELPKAEIPKESKLLKELNKPPSLFQKTTKYIQSTDRWLQEKIEGPSMEPLPPSVYKGTEYYPPVPKESKLLKELNKPPSFLQKSKDYLKSSSIWLQEQSEGPSMSEQPIKYGVYKGTNY